MTVRGLPNLSSPVGQTQESSSETTKPGYVACASVPE
jgi:hypothetical protein